MAQPFFSDQDACLLIARFHRGLYASVNRVQQEMSCAITLIEEMQRMLKSTRWQCEVAWLLDGLRNNAMDGIDLEVGLHSMDEREGSTLRHEIQGNFLHARRALFSSPTPVRSAMLFETPMKVFAFTCNGTISRLQALHQRFIAEWEEDPKLQPFRTRERDSNQGQNPYTVS